MNDLFPCSGITRGYDRDAFNPKQLLIGKHLKVLYHCNVVLIGISVGMRSLILLSPFLSVGKIENTRLTFLCDYSSAPHQHSDISILQTLSLVWTTCDKHTHTHTSFDAKNHVLGKKYTRAKHTWCLKGYRYFLSIVHCFKVALRTCNAVAGVWFLLTGPSQKYIDSWPLHKPVSFKVKHWAWLVRTN